MRRTFFRAELLVLVACRADPQPAPVAVVPLPAPIEASVVLVDASAEEAAPAPKTATIDDPAAWLEAHGAKSKPVELFACSEISIGNEAALRCERRETIGEGASSMRVYRDVIHAVVLAPRAGKVDALLDVVIAIQATDFPELYPLQLRLDLAGNSATLADGEKGCDKALADLDAPGRNADPLSKKWDALDRRLIKDACKKRGPIPLK